VTPRLARYGRASTALSLLSDARFAAMLDAAPSVHSGIGGTAVSLDVDGVPVFAKRVPLTDLEREPEHVRSTANMFGLPPFTHYGVGSAGGGVWRELAAHVMTTDWVLAGRWQNVPLLYHWRVLPGTPPVPDETVDIERWVAYWAGSDAVRVRLEAIAGATASVVLCLEHVPHTLGAWLRAAGADEAAYAMVEREMRSSVSFMNANGLLHFDAHVNNILTDGQRLYLTDFGLATSTRFDLSTVEREFVTTNLSHDGCYGVTQLVNALVRLVVGITDAASRNAYVQRVATGWEPPDLPVWAASTVARYAPVAVVMNDFYWQLHRESRTTPYPADAIAQACASSGFVPVSGLGRVHDRG